MNKNVSVRENVPFSFQSFHWDRIHCKLMNCYNYQLNFRLVLNSGFLFSASSSLSLWYECYRKESRWKWLSIYTSIHLPTDLPFPVDAVSSHIFLLSWCSALWCISKKQSCHIPGFFFFFYDKQDKLLHASSIRAIFSISSSCLLYSCTSLNSQTNFPDSILPIILTNSTSIFPILRKNFHHPIHPEITCPFLHSGRFVPLTASCDWLVFSFVGFFYCALMRNATLQQKFMFFDPEDGVNLLCL